MELEEMKGKVEAVQVLAEDLIKNRGDHCKAQVKPKLEQLNQRFDIVTKRILMGQVMLWKAVCLRYVYKYIEHMESHGEPSDFSSFVDP